MRVIAGTARSLPLKSVEGMDTRPTTDRIKETLFNMIQGGLCDCRFLDLFAGSGGIGIEALSRGAAEAIFVEKAKKACACIRENLQFTRLDSRARLMETDVFSALARLDQGPAFDYIFMDPPYNMDLEKQVLAALSGNSCADRDTVIIVEASKETSFDYLEAYGYEVLKRKEYKTNVHMFVKVKKEK